MSWLVAILYGNITLGVLQAVDNFFHHQNLLSFVPAGSLDFFDELFLPFDDFRIFPVSHEL